MKIYHRITQEEYQLVTGTFALSFFYTRNIKKYALVENIQVVKHSPGT